MAPTPRRLEGKVAVVTASTQGIGFSIAQRLGEEGAAVVISSRKQKNVDEAVEKLKALGINVHGVACHVSVADHRKRMIQQTVDRYGRIDILVSNAAVNPTLDPISKITESAMDKLWDVNVKSAVLLVQEVIPHLGEGSSVIFISSVAAYANAQVREMAMYGVTKTALLGLTKYLAVELAPKVRVNCVAPGFVPTHFAEYITTAPEVRKGLEDQTLLKRLGTPENMAGAVAFLASDDASYVTGETLVIAGGVPSRL